MHSAADIQFWTSTPLERVWDTLSYQIRGDISDELYTKLIAQMLSDDELKKDLEAITKEISDAQTYLRWLITQLTYDIIHKKGLPNLKFGYFKNKLWNKYKTVDGVHFLTTKYTVKFFHETSKWFIERVLRETKV